MSTIEAAPFSWPLRVYYEDTDAGGIVYHASYLRFMERARTEWLRACGFGHGVLRERLGVQLVLSRADVRFRAPARLDEELEATVRLERRGRASLDLWQEVRTRPAPSGTGLSLCSAHIQVACVDIERQRPRPFPPDLLGVLT